MTTEPTGNSGDGEPTVGIPYRPHITEESFIRAQRLHWGPWSVVRVVVLVDLIVMVRGFTYVRSYSGGTADLLVLLGGTLAGSIMLALAVLWWRESRWRKYYRSTPGFAQAETGVISERGHESISEMHEHRVTWGAYAKCRIEDDIILLYPQDAMFVILTRDQFENERDWAAAKAIIARRVPRAQ